MKFQISTKSIFYNVYLVEAETEQDAINQVMDAYDPPEFVQQHQGESVICAMSRQDIDYKDWINEWRLKNYY